jgi:hypothetical protein
VGEETSPPGLGEAMARREQEAGPCCTTRDRPRGLWGSPRRHTTNKADAKAPRGAPEGRECITDPSSYGEDTACQVPLRTKSTWLYYSNLPV